MNTKLNSLIAEYAEVTNKVLVTDRKLGSLKTQQIIITDKIIVELQYRVAERANFEHISEILGKCGFSKGKRDNIKGYFRLYMLDSSFQRHHHTALLKARVKTASMLELHTKLKGDYTYVVVEAYLANLEDDSLMADMREVAINYKVKCQKLESVNEELKLKNRELERQLSKIKKALS